MEYLWKKKTKKTPQTYKHRQIMVLKDLKIENTKDRLSNKKDTRAIKREQNIFVPKVKMINVGDLKPKKKKNKNKNCPYC